MCEDKDRICFNCEHFAYFYNGKGTGFCRIIQLRTKLEDSCVHFEKREI